MRTFPKSDIILAAISSVTLALAAVVVPLAGCAPAPTSASANAKPKAESIPVGKPSSDVTGSLASGGSSDSEKSSPKKEDSPVKSETAKAEVVKSEAVKPAEKATSAKAHPLDQVAPLIPRKVLFGNPDKASARISPDGKKLAYMAPVNGVLNVWVGPIDNPDAAKPVTDEKDRPIPGFNWAFTNKHILYSQDKGGDENFHVFAVNLETGKTSDITPLKNPATDAGAKKEGDAGKEGEPHKVRAEIQEVSWKQPDKVLIGLNERDEQFHDIYLVDINTGEHKLIQENKQYTGFLTDEDYRVRFASQMTPDGGSMLLKPDGKGGWEEFIKIGMDDSMTTSPAGFDETGEVMYLMDSRGRDTGALKTLDLKTGEEKLIAENPLADVGGVLAHPTKNTIQGVSFTYDRTKWTFYDKDVEADYNRLKKLADGELTIASRTLDDRKWIVAFLMDDGPVRYYYYDRDTKEPQFLFSNRKELEGQPLQKMHPVVIDTRDGMKLVSYLTLPPGSDPDGDGRPDKPVPMVLNVHGGPWARDGWGLDPEHQLMANRGYAVLSVNYRGSTGFGKKFINAANKEWAGKMHDDLLDAVDWAVKEKIADSANVAIYGGSYGGYATLVGLTFTPDKFACGVDVVGPSSLVTLLKSIPPYWAPALDMFKTRVGDHTTPEGEQFLNERSPLSKVEEIKRPLLIGQGANDPRVKEAEATQIVYAMKQKQIPVTYVLFPDEGHGFHRPVNNMAFYAVAEAFLAEHLGGRYEPIGDAFKESTITVPAGEDGVPGLSKAIEAASSGKKAEELSK
jgi:dipeptidyl aminopeptidase/acylaminoacyl peptidase